MIEIKDVSKQFGKTRAVDHVSFSVKEENVFGLIGTNGAGKSTMRVCLPECLSRTQAWF